MKERQVKIRHPEMDVESIVIDESVPVWVEMGWEVVDDELWVAEEEEAPPEGSEEVPESVPGDENQGMFDLDEESEPSEASEEE